MILIMMLMMMIMTTDYNDNKSTHNKSNDNDVFVIFSRPIKKCWWKYAPTVNEKKTFQFGIH